MDISKISERNDKKIKFIESLQRQGLREEIIQSVLAQCDRIIEKRGSGLLS